MNELLILMAVVLIASVVRGYSGFGFSALVLLVGGLLVAPHTLVPVLYLMEIAASVWLLIVGGFGTVRWPLLLPLMIGSALTTPVGQFLLSGTDSGTVLMIAGAAVALFCFLLWRGFTLPHTPHPTATFVVGATSGMLNGIGSVGGLPIATYLLATQQSPHQLRGTLAMQVLVLDSYALLTAAWFGLVSTDTWRISAYSLPVLALGMYLGNLLFKRSNPERFRKMLLLLLVALALLHPLRQIMFGD